MTTPALPRWDLSGLYPGPDSPELIQALAAIAGQIDDMNRLFDAQHSRAGALDKREDVDQAMVQRFETVTEKLNALQEELWTIDHYLTCLVAADTQDSRAQAREVEFKPLRVQYQKLRRHYDTWIASLDPDALMARSSVARDYAYLVRRSAEALNHRMIDPEENLAADLSLSGTKAWSALYRDLTAVMMVTVQYPDGRTEALLQSAASALMFDPDEAVRKAVRDASVKSWDAIATSVAAALNGIKGEQHVLNTRRRWADSLDPALFASDVDRATVEAMHAACREAFPDFHRYLRAKARRLGKEQLDGWDLWVPVPTSPAGAIDGNGSNTGVQTWTFAQAADFVVAQFGTYSQPLAELAARAFREHWIDAEPRPGKKSHGFSRPARNGESRILMDYVPSFNSVRILAHELGHAYHNLLLARRAPLQRRWPLALAETGSIFCETIITDAALDQVTGVERLIMLNEDLQGACWRVLGTHSLFLIERRISDLRAKRELTAREFMDIARAAQQEVYGSGITPETHWPYQWASSALFFDTHYPPYYNWPYTFGLLFGVGLYTRYRQDPAQFRASYDELLASTGLDDVATLASRFGIDVRSIDFWRSSLNVYRERIREFEALSAGDHSAQRPALRATTCRGVPE